ncbi:MAG: hypothetical protein QXX95_01905 [Nitrososphaerales archaeon]
MCTIIALSKERFLFMYNRDLPLEGFKGQDLRFFDNLLALYDYRSKGIAFGYSLNKVLFIAVANVLGYYSKLSRGYLARKVLQEAKNLEEALAMMRGELIKGNYSSANYLLGDDKRIFRVENYAEELVVKEVTPLDVVTNHFRFLNKGNKPKDSLEREKFVWRKLKEINPSLNSFKDIAMNHDEVPVCRHGRTLSSLLLEKFEGKLSFLYTLSLPCLGYKELLFY